MRAPMLDPNRAMPRVRSSRKSAAIRPKTPPDAPTVAARGSSTSAPAEPQSTETKKIASRRIVPA